VAPFSLVLLLDVSGSTLGFVSKSNRRALRFTDARLPDDRVTVMAFRAGLQISRQAQL